MPVPRRFPSLLILARALAALSLLTACDRKSSAAKQPSAESTAVVADPDTGVVLARADWKPFEQKLSADPAIAASDLERYRSAHGLPFSFFLAKSAPPALQAALEKLKDEDAMCGSPFT